MDVACGTKKSDYVETLAVYRAGMLEQKIVTCRNRKCDKKHPPV